MLVLDRMVLGEFSIVYLMFCVGIGWCKGILAGVSDIFVLE